MLELAEMIERATDYEAAEMKVELNGEHVLDLLNAVAALMPAKERVAFGRASLPSLLTDPELVVGLVESICRDAAFAKHAAEKNASGVNRDHVVAMVRELTGSPGMVDGDDLRTLVAAAMAFRRNDHALLETIVRDGREDLRQYVAPRPFIEPRRFCIQVRPF